MKLWIIAPAVALVALLGVHQSAFAVASSKVLTFDVTVDAKPTPAGIDSELTRTLTFNVERTVSKPVSGKIVLRYPQSVDPTGRRTQNLPFNLAKGKSARVVTTLTLPQGLQPGQYAFPVEVYTGSKKYLDMDLQVAKAVDWEYVAPFPGGVKSSHDKAFEPESKLDFAATYAGLGGKKVSWHQFPGAAINADGMFEFHTLFPDLNYATGYATTTIYSDTNQKARLLLGSDDSIKVWQNGKLVHSNNILRGSVPGDDKVNITLNKGKNVFLVKVCQDDGAWGFHFAMDDGNEKPLSGIKYSMIARRVYLADPILRLSDVTGTSASITWQSDVPTTSVITVVPAQPGRALPVWGKTPKSAMVKPLAGAKSITVQDDTLSTHHKGAVNGLKPGTRYLISVSPAIGGKTSEPLAFYTAPPAGKTMYVKLRVANVIFTNVTMKSDSGRPGATTPGLKEEIERIKRDCERASRFYWINTGMRVYLQNDFYVTDKHFDCDDKDDPYGVGYQKGDPDEKAFEELVVASGKKVSDYDGRCFISMEKKWNDTTKTWSYPASGGGTIGPEAKPGYGKSAWKFGCVNHWVYTHEFGHELDALYNWSMGPEYIFNHPQPWDGTAHHHGDHYDDNAWLIREWAGYYTHEHQTWPLLEPTKWYRYFTNRWGVVEFENDADNDGIPDNAPNLPLDEARWNSDPTKKDTDGDGLSDIQEVMACEWVDYGLGEIWAGPAALHRCDPQNPDTDGDGIPDGIDPYPLYAVNPKIMKGALQTSSTPDDQYRPFVQLQDATCEADLNLAWDDQNLYIGIRAATEPDTMRIYLDFGDNGWYMGKDNYDLRIRPSGSIHVGDAWHVNPEKTFGAALHNCGVVNKWPFFDPAGLKDGEVKFEQTKTDRGYDWKITIPKNPGNGVKLVPGQKIGVLFAVNPVGGPNRPGDAGDLTVFEPHTLVTVQLTDK